MFVFEGLYVVVVQESTSKKWLFWLRYEALVKHVKPFLKKTLKWKDFSVRTIIIAEMARHFFV